MIWSSVGAGVSMGRRVMRWLWIAPLAILIAELIFDGTRIWHVSAACVIWFLVLTAVGFLFVLRIVALTLKAQDGPTPGYSTACRWTWVDYWLPGCCLTVATSKMSSNTALRSRRCGHPGESPMWPRRAGPAAEGNRTKGEHYSRTMKFPSC